MLQKTLTLIEQSHNIALLLPENPTLDCLLAAEVLACALKNKSKNVGFLAPITPSRNFQAIHFPTLAASLPLPRDFIISINTAKSPVAQLKYEKNEDALDIILSPKGTEVKKEHIAYRAGDIQCDCAILLGGDNADSLAYGEEMPPDFFIKTPLIHISNKTQKNQEETDFIDGEKTSLCEVVYSLISSMDSSLLSQETASLILTGIVNETKNFTHPATDADAFLAASELMRLGASKKSGLLEHKPEYNEKPSLDLLHLCGRAMVRSKIHEDMSLMFSFLTPDDFEKTHEGKDAVRAVLASQKHMLPSLSSHVLFWQTADNDDVHVIAAGKEEKIKEPLFTREEKDSFFVLEKTFPSFGEAENYIIQLIAEKL